MEHILQHQILRLARIYISRRIDHQNVTWHNRILRMQCEVIKQKQQLYKVYRVYFRSERKEIIKTGLTEADARKLVQSYPDSKTSMLVYSKHSFQQYKNKS